MLENQYVHVAVIQMAPTNADPRANVARATHFARMAAREHGAELIVFPECTLTGYPPPPRTEQQLTRDRRLAETVSGPSVEGYLSGNGLLTAVTSGAIAGWHAGQQ